MKINKHTLRCFQDHLGHWMMHEPRLWQLHDFVMGQNIIFEDGEPAANVPEKKSQQEVDREFTTLRADGALIVPLEGTLMRSQSSFGGTSTVQIRRILRSAARDPKVKGVMLAIDSPGGTVAGTDELAGEIRAFGAIKPIHAHVNGLMASAAFWTGSQASRITAARTSEVGSLGTVAVVHDTSEMAEKQGIKVHVISTGPHKGAFTPGSKVTEEQLADLQSIVDKLNGFFMEAVAEARDFSAKEVKALFDGRVHVASDALKLGLIDGVSDFEAALHDLTNEFDDDMTDEEAIANARMRRLR